MATKEKEKIRAWTGGPYAIIEVECLGLPTRSLQLPVVHREDFQRLWHALEERRVAADEELIVVYEPSGIPFIGAFQPRLHVFAYPAGSLEKLHEALSTSGGGRQKFLDLPTPVAEWRWRP
jgi:hypothetical protein